MAELDRRAELILFALALAMIPVVVIQVTAESAEVLMAAEIVNFGIWLAFAAEIAYVLWRSTDRAAVLRRRWLDVAIVLLAPPLLLPPEFASLRILRVLRLVRLVAIAARLRRHGARILGTEGLVYIGFVVFLVVFVGGVSMYELERENVPTVWDGFWFMLVTLTTVGYGDITPHTFEGRLIAGAAMLLGLGTFAALTAALGQILFQPAHKQDDERIARLERIVADLASRSEKEG